MLVVEGPGNRNLELASRNLEGVKVVAPAALQPYDLLRHDRVLLSKDTALRLGRSLGPEGAQQRKASQDNGGARSASGVRASGGGIAASRGKARRDAVRPKPKASSKAKSPARRKRKTASQARRARPRKRNKGAGQRA